jgi:DNA-binding transcriptional LysR family regulator
MEDDMHALMRAAGGATAPGGVVRVSAPPALAAYMLAPRLKGALRRLPGIELDLRAEARMTDLTRRESDIALRFQRPDAPGLAVRLLANVEYGLYASAAYLAEHDAGQWEFLGHNEQLTDVPQQQWLDKFRGARRCCMVSNDLGTLYPGYFFGPKHGGLVRIATEGKPFMRKLWIVMHEDVRRRAAVRAVADEINALFAGGQEPG